jgi:hypothetical protein
LIQYVGWGDTAISPENDINYYNAVTREIGGHEDIREFYRLFMSREWLIAGADPVQMRSVKEPTDRTPPTSLTTFSRLSISGSKTDVRPIKSSARNT